MFPLFDALVGEEVMLAMLGGFPDVPGKKVEPLLREAAESNIIY